MKEALAFTITGINHYEGIFPFVVGELVKCKKEPDNQYDREAIKVERHLLGKVGYVANSSYTVSGETLSAGRLYDKVGETFYGRIVYLMPNKVICVVEAGKKKKLKKEYQGK